jgi:hypothetical protein
MTDVESVWDEVPDALTAVDALADATAAEILIEFLEGYREAWPTIPDRRRAGSR